MVDFNCRECGEEIMSKSWVGLMSHISHRHKISSKEYFDKHFKTGNIGKCKICGNDTSYLSISRGYSEYCSNKCATSDKENIEKSKQTKIERYGENYKELFIEKAKQTSLEKYGVYCAAKSDLIKKKIIEANNKKSEEEKQKIREKIKQTNIKKYGVENVQQLPEIREKIKRTNLERYGTDCYLKTKEKQEKSKITNIEKYGVEFPAQNKDVKQKAMATRYKKNNGKFDSEETIKKRRNTVIEKYGSEYLFTSPIIIDKIKNTNLEKYGVENFSSSNEKKDMWKKMQYDRMINSDRLKGRVIPKFTLSEYNGIYNKYKFQCTKCSHVFIDRISCGRIPVCPICFPKNYGSSKIENELFEFICSLFHDETIIINGAKGILKNGLELDVYIPDKNIAFELDGLFWHSETNKPDHNYHLNKTVECEENGIELIHIFEDEWIENPDKVKSIISKKLGKTENLFTVSDLKIEEICFEEAYDFIHENYIFSRDIFERKIIDDNINRFNIGLRHNNELLAVISGFYIKEMLEANIMCICEKLDIRIPDSYSTLLKALTQKYSVNKISFTIDKRYNIETKECVNFGFKKILDHAPSFSYVNHYTRIIKGDIQENINLLDHFDNSLSEWENSKLSGFDRIFDCGASTFMLVAV